jgi:hypothetical protein
MSGSNRRSNIALGGLVALTFAACVGIAHYIGDENQTNNRDYTAYNETLTEKREAGAKNRRPLTDSSVCRKAETEKEYELCQAWRSADAAADAADTAWKQFLISVLGLLGLGYTVYYTARAAGEASKAASAAAEANKLSRELFIATERPWVKIEVRIDGPLTYSPNGMNVTLMFKVTNVGRSPAVNVWIDAAVHMFTGGESFDLPLQHHQHLADVRARGPTPWGFMLFPGDSTQQQHSVSVPQEALEKGRQFMSAAILSISAYVTYAFVFDRAPHITGFSARLERKEMPRPATDKVKRSPTAIFFDDGDVPAEHLRLILTGLEGEIAD